MKFKKKYIVWFWFTIILLVLAWYFLFGGIKDVNFLQEIVQKNLVVSAIIYTLVLSLRGLTFLPSTPLLFAGLVLFNPFLVFGLNLIGILSSSTLVYYFGKYIGIDTYLENKYPDLTEKIKEKIKDKELPFIALWSLTFFVPTDLVVYAAQSLRVHLWKVLVGVFIGEFVLNGFYIFFSDTVGETLTELQSMR